MPVSDEELKTMLLKVPDYYDGFAEGAIMFADTEERRIELKEYMKSNPHAVSSDICRVIAEWPDDE